MVAIDVAAEKATAEPSEGRARIKDRVAASQMVRTGERNRLSTLWKKDGMPPSLEKANIMRLLLVIENKPQCQTQTTKQLAATKVARATGERPTHYNGKDGQRSIYTEDVH